MRCYCSGFVYDLSHFICLDLQGYRAEMDNSSLASLLPTSLRNKRDVLFGNLPDIYNFHSRQGHTQSHTENFITLLTAGAKCKQLLQTENMILFPVR